LAPVTSSGSAAWSTLALWQAEHVRAEVERRTGKKVEITKIKTTGDVILDVPLSKVGGKGLFVKEIERRCCRTGSTSPSTR